MLKASAYDTVWDYTKKFYEAVGKDSCAEVKSNPAAIFCANGLEPDPAQLELLSCTDRNVLVLWTRQFAGKSQTAAALLLHHAMTNLGKFGRGSTALVFSAGQREAVELLRKVRHLRYGLVHRYIPSSRRRSWRAKSVAKDVKRYKDMVGESGWDEPSIPSELEAVVDAKTMIELENGSRIISLPAKSQATVGYTADLLVLDEAKVIPDDLYKSVRPMLATTGGRMIALSTPLGQRGWFWEACKQCEDAAREGKPPPYRLFKRTCWDCPRLDREFVETERKMIGDFWFEQEYECKFLASVGSVFRLEDVERTLVSEEQPYQVPWG